MTKLVKNAVTSFIPASPGNPGTPYIPAQPARTVVEQRTVCGYNYPASIIQQADGSFVFIPGVPSYTCATENVLVYYPATAPVAAVPYSPPTAAQMVVSLNQGWNSHARTIGSLDVGAYIEYTVKLGTYGALMSLGTDGMDGVPIDHFTHGIMVDTSGVYVFESGVVVATLAATNSPGMTLRIIRLADGRIAYAAGGAVHFSAAPAYSLFDRLFVYGMLYSAYDEVSSAEFFTGKVIYEPAATMRGSGAITMRPQPLARMSGSGDLLVSASTAVVMSGYGAITATLSQASQINATMSGAGDLSATLDLGGRGSITLPAMQAFGSDAESEHIGFGYVELPMFTASGSGGSFVPAQPTVGYVNLPYLTAWGDGSEIDIGTGSISLPTFIGQASEGEYGIGSVSLPRFIASGYGGFEADDEIVLFSTMIAETSHAATIDLVMLLDSAGQLQSTVTLTREQVLELLSELAQSDSFSLLGVYGYSILSGLNALSLQNTQIGSLPDLDGSGVVWVVNTDTQASSQYDGYSFNSFIKRNGVCYGVAPDGIYRLEGGTDAGAQVEAMAYLGRLDFATALKKLMPNAYLGASSTDKLKLEVDADGALYVYETRDNGDGTFRNHRVDLGRGLKANMLGLSVKNKNGADFELATVDILQAPGGRRI